MRKLLVVLVVLGGVLLGADVAARAWAESRLREQAVAYYPPGSTATATIRSFPFLGRLLLQGEVPEASLTMENVQADILIVSSIDLDLERVELDRPALFRGEVRVVDVGRGRVEARIDGSSLARAAGVDIRFGDGVVEIHKTIRGVDVSATARATLDGNQLRLTAIEVQGRRVPLETFVVTYDIPGVELIPCDADLRPVAGALLVSCALDDVPPGLVTAVAGD